MYLTVEEHIATSTHTQAVRALCFHSTAVRCHDRTR